MNIKKKFHQGVGLGKWGNPSTLLKIRAGAPARLEDLGSDGRSQAHYMLKWPPLPVLRTQTAENCFGRSIRNTITCCHRRLFRQMAVDVFYVLGHRRFFRCTTAKNHCGLNAARGLHGSLSHPHLSWILYCKCGARSHFLGAINNKCINLLQLLHQQ